MSSEIAIQVEDLGKCYQIYDQPSDRLKQMLLRGRKNYYREFWALRNVSFEVKRGETVGIVGRNGSGKSTLLQLICGTLNPTGGKIQTSGRISALLELGSGFNPEFTGRENVFLNASLLGLSREQTEACFPDIATFADIGQFIEQPVKTYSSGMLVRLAFAVQAMVVPEILIVDEALAVGDEKFQRKCFARLETLKSQGTSILFVSHSGPQVIELCDRALLLERGERVMYSLPSQVVRAYQRIIYAPNEEQQQLVAAFRQDGSAVPESTSSSEFVVPKKESSAETIDSYDPGLVPETTQVYPVQGAEIARIEIQDVSGRIVNVLRAGGRYRIVVSGRILAKMERVYFGVHIRSISGTVICGQRYPEEGRYINFPPAGAKFKIAFWFNMAMLPDTYFAGGGVWSATDSICAHRIVDAIMFRIQSTGPRNSFGYCDLTSAPADFELV